MENESQPTEIVFQHFTAYKNTLSGVWLEARGQRLQQAILADNGTGAILFQSTLEDAVIVGQSANTIGQRAGGSLEGGVYLLADDGLKAPQLRNVDFIDQSGAGIVVPGTRLHPLSTLSNLQFSNTLPCRIDLPTELTGGFTDENGSVKGDGIPVYIHGGNELAITPGTVFDANINAWVTPLDQLEYLSLTAPDSSADGLGFTLLVGETQTGELPDTGLGDSARSVSGYVEKDHAYTMLRFDPLPAGVRISGSGVTAGFVELQVPFRGAAYVYDELAPGSDTGVPDFTSPPPLADSLAQFTSSTQTVWFDEPATETLDLRIGVGRTIFLFDQPMGVVTASPALALWRVLEFGSQIARDPSAETIWGNLADPDGDGFSNLMEFFLASDPLRPGHPLLFDPALRRLSFTRNPAASDVEFLVSYSRDLTTWYSDTESRETQLPDGTILVDVTVPGLAPDRLFMGLKVRQTP